QTFWLGELANESLGNFASTPEIDRDFSARALLARDDPDEAWQLFRLLAWKIERFVRRYRHWRLAPWELADIVQETYPLFLKTLKRWEPRYVDGEPAGYLYYFLAVYPRWLQNATRQWLRHNRRNVRFLPETDTRVAPDEYRAIVNDFCAHLSAQEASLLRLRLATGATIPRAALALGIRRHRAYIAWNNIVQLGHEYMREAS